MRSNKTTQTLLVITLAAILYANDVVAKDIPPIQRKHQWEIGVTANHYYSLKETFGGIHSTLGVGARYSYRGFGVGLGCNVATDDFGIYMDFFPEYYADLSIKCERHSLLLRGGIYNYYRFDPNKSLSNSMGIRFKSTYACHLSKAYAILAAFGSDKMVNRWLTDLVNDRHTWWTGVGAMAQTESERGWYIEGSLIVGIDHSKFASGYQGNLDQIVRTPEFGFCFIAEIKTGIRLGRKNT